MNVEALTQAIGGLTAEALVVAGQPELSDLALAIAAAAIEVEKAIEAKRVTLPAEVAAADLASDAAEAAKFGAKP